MRAILRILFLSFFICNYSFGQIKISDLKIDTTITGFKFATHFQETKVFTKNGPPDIATINPTAFSFTIAPKVTAEIIKVQFEQFLELSNQNG